MKETRTHPSAQAIKDHLDAEGISMSELARRLGWGRMQVQRRLSGDASLTVAELEEIAKTLGVPVTDLLSTNTQAVA